MIKPTINNVSYVNQSYSRRFKKELYDAQTLRNGGTFIKQTAFFRLIKQIDKSYKLTNLKTSKSIVLSKEFIQDSELCMIGTDHFNNQCKLIC